VVVWWLVGAISVVAAAQNSSYRGPMAGWREEKRGLSDILFFYLA